MARAAARGGRVAARAAASVIKFLAQEPLPRGVFLNLNVPNVPWEQLDGIRVCGTGRRHYEPWVERREDPRGKDYFWIGGAPVGSGMEEGSDGWWIRKGYATLTPLGLDTTQADCLPKIEHWTLDIREPS